MTMFVSTWRNLLTYNMFNAIGLNDELYRPPIRRNVITVSMSYDFISIENNISM